MADPAWPSLRTLRACLPVTVQKKRLLTSLYARTSKSFPSKPSYTNSDWLLDNIKGCSEPQKKAFWRHCVLYHLDILECNATILVVTWFSRSIYTLRSMTENEIRSIRQFSFDKVIDSAKHVYKQANTLLIFTEPIDDPEYAALRTIYEYSVFPIPKLLDDSVPWPRWSKPR